MAEPSEPTATMIGCGRLTAPRPSADASAQQEFHGGGNAEGRGLHSSIHTQYKRWRCARRMLAAVGVGSAADLYDAIPGALKLTRPLDLPPPIAVGARAAQACRGHPRQEQELRGAAELPRRRLLAALRAGDLRRDQPARRVPHRLCRLELFRPRQAAGHLRISEPDRRAGRPGRREHAHLRLGRRRRQRRRHGLPPHRPQARSWSPTAWTAPGSRRCAASPSPSPPSPRSPSTRRPASSIAKTSRRSSRADTAAVYIEVPSSLGIVDAGAPDIVKRAHAKGALAVVGVDPISLGVLEAPGNYGADLVVGDLQPLGMHMNGGGGLAGFIASRDEPRFVDEYPSFLISLTQARESGALRLRRRHARAHLLSQAPRRHRLLRHHPMAVGHHRRRLPLAHGAAGHARAGRGHHPARRLRRRAHRPPSRA